MNLATFGGRLGRDSELNHVASMGENVCNFTLAVDVGTKQNPKTIWVECALFGKRAQTLHQYLKKGVKVTVIGRISLDEYTSKQTGEKKTALRLSVSEIDMHLPPRESGSEHGAPAPSSERRERPTAAPTRGHPDDMDDDIPF